MTARDPIEAAHVSPDPVAVACAEFLSAEFDGLTPAWFHLSERANYIHNRMAEVSPKMRAAIATYLRARADIADTGPIGEWPRMLRNLADEVERNAK